MFRRATATLLSLVASSGPLITLAQNGDQLHEMIATEEGFIAMDTPKDWQRANGPGLAFFLRAKDSVETAPVFMYLSATPYGPNEDAKTGNDVISSDIADFKKRFRNGVAQKDEDIELPRAKAQATVYTFLSGEAHNAFEKIAYIREANRMLIVCLSAKNDVEFRGSNATFESFVRSYGGSIVAAPSHPTELPSREKQSGLL